MSVMTADEKAYLTIRASVTGFTILARPEHASELQALLAECGIPCERHAEARPGKDELAFDWDVMVPDVRRVLHAYKCAVAV
jgi:hypothetical protein